MNYNCESDGISEIILFTAKSNFKFVTKYLLNCKLSHSYMSKGMKRTEYKLLEILPKMRFMFERSNV